MDKTCLKTAALLLTVVALSISVSSMACATSAQIGGSDPSLPVGAHNVDGRVFFSAVLGSDLYDAAGDIGATVPAGSIGSGQIYFFGDLFTWVDVEGNSEFSPRRIIYTLETGYNHVIRNNEVRVFVKHQSFHDVDFTDEIDESYELYGINYRLLTDPQISLRAGKYLNRKDVDYEWDFALTLTLDTARLLDTESNLRLWLHHVTEDGGPRSGFTDYAAEMNLPMRGGFVLFARYEFLHDIDRFAGTSDHHLLIGPRYTW